MVLQQALLFRTRHHLCRQGVAPASTRQLRSQGPVSVHTHRTEEVVGFGGRKGTNEVGCGIGVGGRNGDGNGIGGRNWDMNGHGDRDGAGTGTGTGVEVNKGAQDGNGDRNEAGTRTGREVETCRRTQDGNGDGNGDGSKNSSGNGNEDEDWNGNEDRIGKGGIEAKKCKKPHKSCRRHVGKGGGFGGKRKKCRNGRVGPVATYPDNLENDKEAGGGAQGTQGLTSRESVSSLSRLIRGFRNKYH